MFLILFILTFLEKLMVDCLSFVVFGFNDSDSFFRVFEFDFGCCDGNPIFVVDQLSKSRRGVVFLIADFEADSFVAGELFIYE